MCKAKITTTTLERQGEHLCVEICVLLTCARVGKDSYRLFTPLLSDGCCQLELPSVLVAGWRYYWSLRWSLLNLSREVLSHYRIKKVFKAVSHTTVNYKYEVRMKYQDWMADAQIVLAS